MKTKLGLKQVLAVVAVAAALLALAPSGARASAPAPEYYPLCSSPQDIAPMALAGGSAIYARTAVAWNGKEYGVAWVDGADNRLHFRRFFADGTPAAPAVLATGILANATGAPALVWNGTGYAVCWYGYSGVDTYYQAYFARLTSAGALIGSEVKASFVGMTEKADALSPSLAFNGSGYAVAWYDNRNSATAGYDIFATLLNGDGTIANAGASHDCAISNYTGNQSLPAVAWSSGLGNYIVVWQDYRSATHTEIYGASLAPGGGVTQLNSGSAIVSGSSNSYVPSLADNGAGLGLAWEDYRDGNWEIYFASLNASGAKIGSDLRLTSDGNYSISPFIVWTGAEFGVFWQDGRPAGASYNLWMQRVSGSGSLQGGNVQVASWGSLQYPGAAFARYGYLASGCNYQYANYVQPVGCNYAYAPPCPENLVAYNITGTTATISWLPAIDTYTDIAYYQVYRNNALVGLTSDTFYADSGLALNTAYNYSVRTVNAAQNVSTGCGSASSIYVKSNATLTLMVNKSAPNAALSWSDITLNNYNVFRGTSPQVMQKIGSTSGTQFDDPNVLNDNVLYFYTVDEPGQ